MRSIWPTSRLVTLGGLSSLKRRYASCARSSRGIRAIGPSWKRCSSKHGVRKRSMRRCDSARAAPCRLQALSHTPFFPYVTPQFFLSITYALQALSLTHPFFPYGTPHSSYLSPPSFLADCRHGAGPRRPRRGLRDEDSEATASEGATESIVLKQSPRVTRRLTLSAGEPHAASLACQYLPQVDCELKDLVFEIYLDSIFESELLDDAAYSINMSIFTILLQIVIDIEFSYIIYIFVCIIQCH